MHSNYEAQKAEKWGFAFYFTAKVLQIVYAGNILTPKF